MSNNNNAPKHIAIIMDGNNRWAKKQGLAAVSSGHSAGAETIRGVLRTAREQGVHALTLFAFSSENWDRPKTEVDALMRLLANYLKSELDELTRENVRVRFIGRRDRFNGYVRGLIEKAETQTLQNTSAVLTIAADYGGKWDIAHAAEKMVRDHSAEEIAEKRDELLERYMCLADLPAPDLLVRTGGEYRISNFMLWQCAYSELYFTDVLWPDFTGEHLQQAIATFHNRERRFGKTSEQIKSDKHA